MYNIRKNNDPTLRKLSDGQADRQTDRPTDRRTNGQTDESDFIGCCPTNAKRPHVINDSNSN